MFIETVVPSLLVHPDCVRLVDHSEVGPAISHVLAFVQSWYAGRLGLRAL